MANGNERIDFEIDPDDEFGEDYEDPGSLTPEQVRGTVVYTLDWSVKTVIDQIDADPDDPLSEGVLVTSPPFQRRTAWNDKRQSLFIESLMLGLPIPPLVLAESLRHQGQFYVLDGKQRLTALRRFARDEGNPLRLTGLELLSDALTGKTYSLIRENVDLRPYVQSLMRQPVRTIVVRNWRTPSLLHLIFSRLNRASVPLASHELRQAIFPGRFTNFINERSATSRPLRRARRLTDADVRLRDAETLLRYIGLRTNIYYYRGDLRDFLDRVIKGGNEHYSDVIDDIEAVVAAMESAINATFEIFGRLAFLRFDAGRNKYMPRFNVAVFEIMCWYFADQDIARVAVQNAEAVRAAYEELCAEDSEFAGYLTSTTKTAAAVVGRIERWGSALGNVLNLELDYEVLIDHVLPLGSRR